MSVVDFKQPQPPGDGLEWERAGIAQHPGPEPRLVPHGVVGVGALLHAVDQLHHADDPAGGQIGGYVDPALLAKDAAYLVQFRAGQVGLFARVYQQRAPVVGGPGAIFNGFVPLGYQPGPGLAYAERFHASIVASADPDHNNPFEVFLP